MTQTELLHIVQKPWEVNAQHADQLDALIKEAPYFGIARLLRTRLMANEEDIRFSTTLLRNAIYAPSPTVLHQLMHTQPDTNTNDSLLTRQPTPEQRESLSQLAEKMKQARQAKRQAARDNSTNTQVEAQKETQNIEITYENYKKNLKNHNYLVAIEILKQLNLHNSKKSVYFADQMRYLQLLLQIQERNIAKTKQK